MLPCAVNHIYCEGDWLNGNCTLTDYFRIADIGSRRFFRLKKQFSLEKLNIEEEQRRIIESAEIKAETLIKEAQLEAKSRLLEMKGSFDAETQETREELKKEARRLSKKKRKTGSG